MRGDFMIDNDDNYYDVSNEDFARIRNTGKSIFGFPIYMQKVKMPATNPNFIQVGMVSFRENNETKAIFARRTKELENGQRQAIENFAKSTAPYFWDTYFMCERAEENYEQFIADQTTEMTKKVERIKKKAQREIEKIETEYNQRIALVKKILENRKAHKET